MKLFKSPIISKSNTYSLDVWKKKRLFLQYNIVISESIEIDGLKSHLLLLFHISDSVIVDPDSINRFDLMATNERCHESEVGSL